MNNSFFKIILLFFLVLSCEDESSDLSSGGNKPQNPAPPETTQEYDISLKMKRLDKVGLDPFVVIVTLKENGKSASGKKISISVPKGSVSKIIDHKNGDYSFTVTPTETGEYPVNVSYKTSSIKRTAVVLDSNISGSGQPMAVPGDYINTDGYEDGATITSDGEYLFVQYGPIYFSGILNFSSICQSSSYTAGYDLNTCDGRLNSSLVFNTIGPYDNYQRPRFPLENIHNKKLLHLDDLILPNYFNGIVSFPAIFYGFKRQQDGTFAEPFKLAFNDEKGVNGPFGPSFIINKDGTATFLIAWNNYFDGNADGGISQGEDDKPDIYYGNLNLGQDKNLGDVTYASNDGFSSITPYINPVGFSSHQGVQGNPHAYTNHLGEIVLIWTDDEQVSHDLSVYRLTSGTFPNGSWKKETLPSKISTSAEENQPFFTGDKLYFRRGSNIVYHDYKPLNGSCSSNFTHNDCWGDEVVVLGANGNTGINQIFSVGEPTISQRDGKKYLYFVYVLRRPNTTVTLHDWNINVGFIEL